MWAFFQNQPQSSSLQIAWLRCAGCQLTKKEAGEPLSGFLFDFHDIVHRRGESDIGSCLSINGILRLDGYYIGWEVAADIGGIAWNTKAELIPADSNSSRRTLLGDRCCDAHLSFLSVQRRQDINGGLIAVVEGLVCRYGLRIRLGTRIRIEADNLITNSFDSDFALLLAAITPHGLQSQIGRAHV